MLLSFEGIVAPHGATRCKLIFYAGGQKDAKFSSAMFNTMVMKTQILLPSFSPFVCYRALVSIDTAKGELQLQQILQMYVPKFLKRESIICALCHTNWEPSISHYKTTMCLGKGPGGRKRKRSEDCDSDDDDDDAPSACERKPNFDSLTGKGTIKDASDFLAYSCFLQSKTFLVPKKYKKIFPVEDAELIRSSHTRMGMQLTLSTPEQLLEFRTGLLAGPKACGTVLNGDFFHPNFCRYWCLCNPQTIDRSFADQLLGGTNFMTPEWLRENAHLCGKALVPSVFATATEPWVKDVAAFCNRINKFKKYNTHHSIFFLGVMNMRDVLEDIGTKQNEWGVLVAPAHDMSQQQKQQVSVLWKCVSPKLSCNLEDVAFYKPHMLQAEAMIDFVAEHLSDSIVLHSPEGRCDRVIKYFNRYLHKEVLFVVPDAVTASRLFMESHETAQVVHSCKLMDAAQSTIESIKHLVFVDCHLLSVEQGFPLIQILSAMSVTPSVYYSFDPLRQYSIGREAITLCDMLAGSKLPEDATTGDNTPQDAWTLQLPTPTDMTAFIVGREATTLSPLAQCGEFLRNHQRSFKSCVFVCPTIDHARSFNSKVLKRELEWNRWPVQVGFSAFSRMQNAVGVVAKIQDSCTQTVLNSIAVPETSRKTLITFKFPAPVGEVCEEVCYNQCSPIQIAFSHNTSCLTAASFVLLKPASGPFTFNTSFFRALCNRCLACPDIPICVCEYS